MPRKNVDPEIRTMDGKKVYNAIAAASIIGTTPGYLRQLVSEGKLRKENAGELGTRLNWFAEEELIRVFGKIRLQSSINKSRNYAAAI